ncbi:MAG: DegT/DnrJ/EryC1/StrS family aminotransferase [Planctomycetes bacterium]|nr:DegT/DnrJ/EryC1/StrS family aminotransferase [Planctomycetota bacterium]
MPDPVFVTQPTMPKLEDYHEYMKKIWQSRWLTNDGQFHQEFERRLKEYLGIEQLNLFVNGTIALLVALQALRINSGEVITTPFTFAATPHVLYWNNIKPVFCDIDAKTFNIDPSKIEGLIRPDTKAILAVHVYGNPCNVEAIQTIADRHGLNVIYDAAHAFGVKIGNESIMNYGDISAMSFHATKLFSSIEGGALVSKTQRQRTRIQFLRNFGIADAETVIGPGINGKMNEFQASFGLLELDLIEKEISDRRELVELYRERLARISGVSCLSDIEGVRHNYAYFPVLIDKDVFGTNRDGLFDILGECNIFPRKYFYPLCSTYPCYSALPSSSPENLPVATHVSEQVLCLPLYGQLEKEIVKTICDVIRKVHEQS